MSIKKEEEARESALRYIAARDRSCGEVIKHLKEKEFSHEEAISAVAYLQEMNYINDEEYALRYTGYLIEKGKGKIHVKNELKKKEIPEEIIEEMLADEEWFGNQSERERALAQGEKIMAGVHTDLTIIQGDDYETKSFKYKEQQRVKGKIGRRLVSMGFSSDTTMWVISRIQSEYF